MQTTNHKLKSGKTIAVMKMGKLRGETALINEGFYKDFNTYKRGNNVAYYNDVERYWVIFNRVST